MLLRQAQHQRLGVKSWEDLQGSSKEHPGFKLETPMSKDRGSCLHSTEHSRALPGTARHHHIILKARQASCTNFK